MAMLDIAYDRGPQPTDNTSETPTCATETSASETRDSFMRPAPAPALASVACPRLRCYVASTLARQRPPKFGARSVPPHHGAPQSVSSPRHFAKRPTLGGPRPLYSRRPWCCLFSLRPSPTRAVFSLLFFVYAHVLGTGASFMVSIFWFLNCLNYFFDCWLVVDKLCVRYLRFCRAFGFWNSFLLWKSLNFRI